jgi:hypothetical protein
MPQVYTEYQGQTPGEGAVLERVRTPRGGIEIALPAQEAAVLRAGRQIMERWHGALSVLADNARLLPK